MTEISILIRAKRAAALNKTINSIVQQKVKVCNVFLINYGVSQKDIEIVSEKIKESVDFFKLINTTNCWANDLNSVISELNTHYCIICNEGTEWSPDYLRMSCVDLKTIQKKYNNIAAYVCRGTETYGYYVQNIFRKEETHHIQPALEEGFINISDMIFRMQFSLDQAIFSTSFVKNAQFNSQLGAYAYWDFCLQIIFQGNIYATNQQHTFMHFDYKEPPFPWGQNNILKEFDKNEETCFHNHIFRNSALAGSTLYNRVATERGFGHVYHLVHAATEKMNSLNDKFVEHENRIDRLDILLKKQEVLIEGIKEVSQSVFYNAFLLKAGKVFEGLGRIKRNILKNGR
ncbi:hypothetical protein [Acetobacter senegalensis]|uniref:hypothetical protein n=1 Tax=Acetobacter senegalensis TaxID=446692 RepID=UPI00264CD669|nr:hypothetical protein [Acetobacter senegalensis]MDN7352374.1 hypothetical protein [Acetobacter senegalensis]